MELNFINIILSVFLVWEIFVLIFGHNRRKKYPSPIFSLSKEKQKEFLKNNLKLIGKLKYPIYLYSIILIFLGYFLGYLNQIIFTY
jgi:hypothetical protein